MIVTCASCLTKYNLDDSLIQATGVKVRCSRCKHIFYVVPPPETKEEILEKVESFARYHEDMMESGEKKEEVSPELKAEKKEVTPVEKEEAFLFSEKAFGEEAEKVTPSEKVEAKILPEKMEEEIPSEKREGVVPVEPELEERVETKPSRARSLKRAEQRGPARFFVLLIILALLVFGVFYVWSELSSGGRLFPYLEGPVKKVTEWWNQIWGTEKENLIVGDLSGYEEKINETPLFVIQGMVTNQSAFNKKHIKIKVVIYDQNRFKVAEKEAICGRSFSREELKRQPLEFFRGEMVVKPETQEKMITPAGKATPFMVIFKDPPSQAKEFKVEIVEAPNL